MLRYASKGGRLGRQWPSTFTTCPTVFAGRLSEDLRWRYLLNLTAKTLPTGNHSWTQLTLSLRSWRDLQASAVVFFAAEPREDWTQAKKVTPRITMGPLQRYKTATLESKGRIVLEKTNKGNYFFKWCELCVLNSPSVSFALQWRFCTTWMTSCKGPIPPTMKAM